MQIYSLSEKAKLADYLIENDGTLEELEKPKCLFAHCLEQYVVQSTWKFQSQWFWDIYAPWS